MNIRCTYCQTPFTLSRVAMLDALQEVDSQNLSHYDFHCPRCRRANPIPRKRLEMAMPKWREDLKAFEAEMKENPQQEAPAPGAEPAAQAEAKPEPKTARAKQPAAEQEPAEEKPSRAKRTTATPAKKATKKSK
ncbi:MAG TPA: hypothetical protein VK900_09745 [Anaerolineales bacterium]|nr:hypothetical protein [Anaerolineales bacterium]